MSLNLTRTRWGRAIEPSVLLRTAVGFTKSTLFDVASGSPEKRLAKIEALIDEAGGFAEKGKIPEAITCFKKARSKLVHTDPVKVAAAIEDEHRKLNQESADFEQRAKMLSSEAKAIRKAVVVSDSLGLPRGAPGSKTEASKLEMTASGLILEAILKTGSASVQPLCRRYGTTAFMLEALHSRADCKNADVLIHIGLNDCVVRMFMEDQRLALSTLAAEVRQKIVKFAQDYRVPLVESDLEHTYTPLPVYERRLEEAANLARSKGARSVTFVTIIQPPTKFGAKTPHMSWSFNRFNMVLYDVAKRERCHLIDMDRLCWEQGTQITLSSDGMHLSAAGHALMAEKFITLVKV
ncbi:hypothetical protein GOD82_26680 [Sinorhizobium medicae]|nr:hypothetical protein [Sinorhizobium medicae]